jgi:hypothetical protein
MFKKIASVAIVTVLVCTLGETAAFANNIAKPDEKTDTANVPFKAPAKEEAKPNEQLKNNMLKLVADTRAGKIGPVAKSQIQPATSNNLSKKTKITIGVVAVTVVVLILVVNHVRNHLFDDFHPFRQTGN